MSAPLIGHVHDDAAKCPTYYDGCNCTVETLDANIERAEQAEAERDKLRGLLERCRRSIQQYYTAQPTSPRFHPLLADIDAALGAEKEGR